MELNSSAFTNSGVIPDRHSRKGGNISPPLSWGHVPAEVKSFAIICDDLSAPVSHRGSHGNFVHWVIYNLGSHLRDLPEGLPTDAVIENPVEALQGLNSFGDFGYGGPQPPKGDEAHHYKFSLYALDTNLSLPEGVKKEDVLTAMTGHILAIATLVGDFETSESHRRSHTPKSASENRPAH